VSNVRLFAGYLVRGKSVRQTPSGRISVYHYERWPIKVGLHWDRHIGRRWWFSGHGIEESYRDGFDGQDVVSQPVFTTIFRVGPLLIQFGRWHRR
jgi:hypothetical protein